LLTLFFVPAGYCLLFRFDKSLEPALETREGGIG